MKQKYKIFTALGVVFLISAVVFFFIAQHFVQYSSDSSAGILMAKDILHGNVLLKGWYIPRDHFLTTDILFFIPCIALFGVTPVVPEIISGLLGALIFVVAIGVSLSGISKEKYYTAASITVAMLFSSFFFLSHLLTIPAHGFTALFALVSIYGTYKYCTNGNIWYLVLSGIPSVLGAFGDPLYLAVVTLPISIVVITSIVQRHAHRREYWIGFTQLLAVLIGLGANGIFGKIGPTIITQQLQIATIPIFLQNIQTFVQLTFQSYGANIFGQFLTVSIIPLVISLIKIGAVVFVFRAVIRTRSQGTSDFLSNILFMSVITSSLAFLMVMVSGSAQGVDSVRYLLPVFVCAAPLVGRSIAGFKMETWVKSGVILASALCVLITSRELLITKPELNAPAQLGPVLAEHGLSRGYGTYYSGTSATLYSDGKSWVSPLNVNNGVPTAYNWLSSEDWYKVPANFLVVWSNDPESLFNSVLPVAGNPVNSFTAGGYTVYVWDHDITPAIHP